MSETSSVLQQCGVQWGRKKRTPGKPVSGRQLGVQHGPFQRPTRPGRFLSCQYFLDNTNQERNSVELTSESIMRTACLTLISRLPYCVNNQITTQ